MSSLVESAVATLESMGWKVIRASDRTAAGQILQELVGESQRAVAHHPSVGDLLDLSQILGPRLVPEAARGAILTADFGITGATAIVAATGSVMLAEEDGSGRLISNLPYRHIVLAASDQVVADLDDALARAGWRRSEVAPKGGGAGGNGADGNGPGRRGKGSPVPRYISFITGPSKTGDIEFEIVAGMHGPRYVWLILLDSPPGR